MSEKGFTLIELIIAIVLIVILAIGVLSAINPIEHLKRSHDAKTIQTLKEVDNALQRYESLTLSHPWCTPNCQSVCCELPLTPDWGGSPGLPPSKETLGDYFWQRPDGVKIFTLLENEGEVPQSYEITNSTELAKIFINYSYWNYNDDTDNFQNPYTLCFMPESSTWQHNPDVHFTAIANPYPNCISQGGNVNCFWCMKNF